MENAVDLTARESGLLPTWLFLLVLAVWVVAIFVAFRHAGPRFRELPWQLIALGSLFLGNALFFWRPLFTAAHIPRGGGDLSSFFFSLHSYSAYRMSSWELPLWNPYLHGGMPHLGNYQAAVLYPPNLLAYLIAQPFTYATLEWLVMAHYVIASVGVYTLVRALGGNRTGSVAAGLIFAYGGFMVAHLGHYSMISVAAWVPWLLFGTYRVVHSPGWFRAGLLAMVVFLAATGGHQQTLLFGLAGTTLWWLFLVGKSLRLRVPGIGLPSVRQSLFQGDADIRTMVWMNGRPGNLTLGIAQFVAAIGAGLAMAMPMILPSLQLARRSVRSSLSYEQASEFSVQPIALLQLILPTVFGSNPTDYWGPFSSGEIWGYVGVSTLILAAIGLAQRPSALRLFFALVALVSVLYAVGPWTPIHGWVYQFVPLFDLIRAPARAYLWMNLAVAVLAGLAITDLTRYRRHIGIRFDRVLRRSIVAVGVAVAAITLFVLPLFYSLVLGVNDPSNRPVIAIDNLQVLLLILLLVLMVLWLARRNVLRTSALGVVVVLVIVLDVFSATAPFNPTDEDLTASYREPEIAAFLAQQWRPDDPFRVEAQHPGLQPNFGLPYGIHVASGVFDPMQPALYTTLVNRLSQSPEHPAYDMLNIRYVVTPDDAEMVEGFTPVFESAAGNVLWERESALPRVWFAGLATEAPHDRSLDTVLDPGFDPATVVVISDPPVVLDGASSGAARLSRFEPERLVIEVESNGPGFVVISAGSYPGWVATIDGQGADVLVANHGLQAVAIDENSERVELQFRPDYWIVGWILSIAGVLAGLAMLGSAFLRTRTRSGGRQASGQE